VVTFHEIRGPDAKRSLPYGFGLPVAARAETPETICVIWPRAAVRTHFP
jgi:hypothetical protein